MESVSHSDIVPSRPVTFTAPVSHQSSPHKFSKADNFDPRKHGDSLPGPANLDRKLRQFASMGYTVLVRPEEFENHILPDETRSLLRDPDPSVVKQIRRECLFRRREKPRPTENDYAEFVVRLINEHNLCPQHKATLSGLKPAENDSTKSKVDAALYVKEEAPTDSRPDWVRCRLFIEFKRGGTSLDPFDDTKIDNPDSKAETREDIRSQLTAYAHNVFFYQHRAWLYSLLVNGEEFRVMRWDRSGVIVTKKMNYFEDPEFLLRFLAYFGALSQVAQGTDPTATLINKDWEAYKMMERYAKAMESDLDHTDDTAVPPPPVDALNGSPSASMPASLPHLQRTTSVTPRSSRLPLSSAHHTCSKTKAAEQDANGPPPPPFPSSEALAEGDIDPEEAGSEPIHEDPRVFRYVRKKFAESLKGDWPCYILFVGDDKRAFLVGKPVFFSVTMFGRATRGYIALDVKSGRFMFLKDSWRPFYVGVEPEGVYLEQLMGIKDEKIKREVRVPRLFCHGDVEEQRSFTAAYAEWLANHPGDASKQPVAGRCSADGTSSALTPHVDEPSPTPNDRHPPSSPPPRTLLGKRSRETFDSAQEQVVENEQKSTDDQRENLTAEPEEPSHRLYTHYRIVVRDVCLQFSEFTSARQLATLIAECITTHRHAFEQLRLLHRDISAGNVLILPQITMNRAQALRVRWHAVLTDWELAKVVPEDPLAEQSARQPERTGTWQFMSAAYAQSHLRRPVAVADELESFFHVMLFYAIRYLRSTAPDVGQFIYSYFDEHLVEGGTRTCNSTKSLTMEKGAIRWGRKRVYFLTEDEDEHDQLNNLMDHLLELFKARYECIDWQEAKAAAEERAAAVAEEKAKVLAAPMSQDCSSEGTVVGDPKDHRSPGSSAREAASSTSKLGDAQVVLPQGFAYVYEDDAEKKGAAAATAPQNKAALKAKARRIVEPSETTKERAESLDTHGPILEVFEDALRDEEGQEMPWPAADAVPDRCPGYYDPRGQTIALYQSANPRANAGDGDYPPAKKIKTDEPMKLPTIRSHTKRKGPASEPDFGTARGGGDGLL
ncbi:hypothetical protein C8Q77DRAFT_1161860 [Trametes polyzona]|nr:hypothetical protein C8Q77DRAFT_1161860 [Trametes polyzona]